MCDLHGEHGPLPPLDADEFRLDTARVRGFVADVRERIAQSTSPPHACELIRPLFAELLADRGWLPRAYREPAVGSGMGGGIGQWLVFRAADRSLALFSLVVPPGAMTPVHDHLAWGLVGVYRGVQDEEFYRPGDGKLALVRRRPVNPGDFYTLLAAARRRPSRADDLRGDVGVDPPARERHRLRVAPHLRRADRRGQPVPLRVRERRVRVRLVTR